MIMDFASGEKYILLKTINILFTEQLQQVCSSLQVLFNMGISMKEMIIPITILNQNKSIMRIEYDFQK